MKTKYGVNDENKIFIHDKNIPQLLRFCINTSMPIFSIWYNLIIMIAKLKIKRIKKKHYFSICAIFKDESLILKEWIEFHKIIGVDHFYLYNNNSSDNYKNILAPYIEDGIVTLIEWNYPAPSQFSSYKHFYDNFWSDTNWVAYIDLDEFICPIRSVSIKDWIKQYQNYGSIVAYWKQFGTSGKVQHETDKLVTEQYIICWDKYYDIGKTFVNTDYSVFEFSAKNLHAMSTGINLFGFKINLPPINEFKKFIKFKSNRIGLFRSSKHFSLQINHYGTKAFDNYENNKLKKGDVNNHIRNMETFYWAEQYNTTVDYKIYRFMLELKQKLASNNSK